MPSTAPEAIAVAVGLLIKDGLVLVARRPAGVHLADLWEFPGGKIEPGESVEEALQREFQEELGIQIAGISRLMDIEHSYREKRVVLRVHLIRGYSGQVEAREGQKLCWCAPASLSPGDFPAANHKILDYLQREDQFD